MSPVFAFSEDNLGASSMPPKKCFIRIYIQRYYWRVKYTGISIRVDILLNIRIDWIAISISWVLLLCELH